MSAHPNPGIDQDPISTGFISLTHLLEIINMLGIGLPANSTDLVLISAVKLNFEMKQQK